jgi:hypothetical protein
MNKWILFTLPSRAEIEDRILLTFFDKKKLAGAGFYGWKGRVVFYTQPIASHFFRYII